MSTRSEKSALLSHEETLMLIASSQDGDGAAREKLIEKNTPLVASIVRGFLGRGIEYDDLMQLGSMGLLKAIDGFDPSFGVRFSTYAVPMIAGEIKRFLRDDGIIKVSRSLKENAAKIFRAGEQLKTKLGRDATIGELCEETGMERGEIVEALDAVRDPISIFDQTGDDAPTLLETYAVDTSHELVDRIMLEQLLSSLTPREQQLIKLRFFDDKTQSEIAKIVGVSQVQVSRLLMRTLKKLREKAEL